VLLPGDPELAAERERSRDGIPLPASTWAALEVLAGELGVTNSEALGVR
jgi:LDH2 family malate/lactate/ureidoglycolate dehydrogenase